MFKKISQGFDRSDSCRWQLALVVVVFSSPLAMAQGSRDGIPSEITRTETASESRDDPWSDEPRQLVLPLSFVKAERHPMGDRLPPTPERMPMESVDGAEAHSIPPTGDTEAEPQAEPEGSVRPVGFHSPLLRPRRDATVHSSQRKGAVRRIATMVSALSIVLGLFFGFVWLTRRVHRGNSQLPTELIQLLGRFPLSPRQQAHVVRFGSKILVLAVSASATSKLAELSDPEEVENLTSICLSGRISPRELQREMSRVVRDREHSVRPFASREHTV